MPRSAVTGRRASLLLPAAVVALVLAPGPASAGGGGPAPAGAATAAGVASAAPAPTARPLPRPATPTVVGLAARALGLPAPATAALPRAATPARAAPPTGSDSDKRRQTERAALDLEARLAADAQAEASRAAAAAAEAHKRALKAAREARDAHERALATERARIEKAKLEIANAKRTQAAAREAASTLARKRYERVEGLAGRAKAAAGNPSKADALYLELVKVLEAERLVFVRDLNAMSAPQSDFAPTATENAAPALADVPEPRRRELEVELAKVRATRGNVVADERRQRLAACAATAGFVRRLNDLRTGLIDHLSPAARSELFGLTSAGLAQFRRELRHLQLLARWYPTSRLSVVRVPHSIDELILKFSALTMSLLKGLLVFLIWWLSRRRWRGWVAELRKLLQGRTARSLVWRVTDGLLQLTLLLGKEIGWLLAVVIAFTWVLDATLATELHLIYELLLIWAIYRLVLAATHRFFTSAARLRLKTRHVEVSEQLSARILASVRLVSRYGFSVWALLSLAEHTVGPGYLYLLVVRFSWVGALPIAFLLVQRWQADISEAYLRAYPSGGLASLVERTQNKPVGLIVAFAAFAYVALRGVALWAGDVAMSFDETRRVLAYLFRRELERRAEQLHVAEPVVALPGTVQAAFADDPAGADDLVETLPQLDVVSAALDAWVAGGPAKAVLVTGAWGSGKTTWLHALARYVLATHVDQVELLDLRVDDRPRDALAAVRWFGQHMGHADCQSSTELIDALLAGPRRVVIVDDVGHLVLRAMGGTTPWVALSDLIGATRGHIFWVVASSRHAAYLAEKLLPGRDTYDLAVKLPRWTEEQIGSLIGQRMESCGAEADFDDLWVTLDDGQDRLLEDMRAGERFIRLLWDHSDGNPRDALYFWLRSLVPDGGDRVRVHLFHAHTADELEHLRTLSRFTLQAVLVHNGLSAAEVARVLYDDVTEVRTTLRWLTEQGIIEPAGERWRVAPAWYRAAVRYLRRKHLLPGE